MMRKKLIVANWKSNKNPNEAAQWLDDFFSISKHQKLKTDDFEIVICPPFIDIPVLKEKLSSLQLPFSISLGAQNVSPFPDGSYTGAVSAKQLKGLIKYCLVGHSERRKNFSETTQSVTDKVALLLAENIKPIICAQSLADIPSNIKNFPYDAVVVMFEPAKAISSGGVYKAETPEVILKTITDWKKELGSYQFLYGGSVNPENASILLSAGVEGFVIGHASLTPDTFYKILINV